MPDETNDLLRQILAIQQEHLAAYKKETERAADFRITAIEMQKAASRRAIIGALVVVAGGLIILLGVMASP